MNKQLNGRKEKILSIIINAYVETGEPVGSRSLALTSPLDLSAATIRNEMSDLEDAGLVMHPHTSAGRIPTDLGYRYFIDNLLQRESIPVSFAETVTNEFRKETANLDDLIQRASRILTTITEQAGIVSYPEMTELYFLRLELIRVDARNISIVWISTSGLIQNYMIDMGEEISDDALHHLLNFFNGELRGLPFSSMPEEIRRKLSSRRDSLHQLYERASQLAQDALKKIETTTRVCLEGSSKMLDKPEFQDIQKTRLLFQALENKDRLLDLFRETRSLEGVSVRVGRENKWEEMRSCSLVAANYKWHGKTVGVLGVLGPCRMRYASIISLVNYISYEMSQVLEKWANAGSFSPETF